ncbi:hypothetical protein DVH05_000586 [Phytophthora capsici]|nr:hypothetical protein DVH05_000586 [Phytophthora capsici]
MRFFYFLLLTSAALLSNCNATATVSGEGHVMTSADAPARALETNNGKRSLRYYATDEDVETDKYDQKNGKYDNDDEEERNLQRHNSPNGLKRRRAGSRRIGRREYESDGGR